MTRDTARASKPKKRRFDLRAYWPWYERHWPTASGGYALRSATPPPFRLGEISDEPTLLPRRQRIVAQVVCVIVAVLLAFVVLWGLFVTK
jgi:hypothetical protein